MLVTVNAVKMYRIPTMPANRYVQPAWVNATVVRFTQTLPPLPTFIPFLFPFPSIGVLSHFSSPSLHPSFSLHNNDFLHPYTHLGP